MEQQSNEEQTLTVRQLIELLSDMDPDYKVYIPLSQPSIGPTAAEGIVRVGSGFDWDNRRLFLYTKEAVVRKTQNISIYQKARDLLMWLATKPTKRPPYEVRRARQILISNGYTEEYFEKYRHLFHEDKNEQRKQSNSRVSTDGSGEPVARNTPGGAGEGASGSN